MGSISLFFFLWGTLQVSQADRVKQVKTPLYSCQSKSGEKLEIFEYAKMREKPFGIRIGREGKLETIDMLSVKQDLYAIEAEVYQFEGYMKMVRRKVFTTPGQISNSEGMMILVEPIGKQYSPDEKYKASLEKWTGVRIKKPVSKIEFQCSKVVAKSLAR